MLRVGLISGDGTDPWNAIGDGDGARMHAMWDGLVEMDPNYRVRMRLAESLEPNKDATIWTVRIRDGVTFHSGKDLTSADVAYSFNYALDTGNSAAIGSKLASSGLTKDGIKVLDDRTVQLTLGRPFSILPEVLAEAGTSAFYVVPDGYAKQEGPWTAETTDGTGPFKFKSFTPGQQSVLVRNDNYWEEGRPWVDELQIFSMNDSNARVNALVSGQVDITKVPVGMAELVKRRNDLQLINSKTGTWTGMWMNIDSEPFNDVRVRQAFRLMVDRPQMVENVLSGFGQVGNDLAGIIDPLYNKELPQREQDLDQAKFLLRQAGQEDLAVTLFNGQLSQYDVPAGSAFANYAKQAGVNCKVRTLDQTSYFDNYYRNESFGMDFWGGRGVLSQALQSMPDAPYNSPNWRDEEWQGLVQDGLAATDQASAEQIVHDLQAIEYDRGAQIIFGFEDVLVGTSSKVQGIEPDVSGRGVEKFARDYSIA